MENRFCFEGGSACGRLEGVYVLVTDQGDEITASFRAASEGKLIPRRKQVIRNMSGNILLMIVAFHHKFFPILCGSLINP